MFNNWKLRNYFKGWWAYNNELNALIKEFQ